MKTEMVSRTIQVYTMPLTDGTAILHPELAIVKIGSSPTIDVGILCYSQRSNSEPGRLRRKVALDSLSQPRIEHVRRLLTRISETMKSSAASSDTIYDLYSRLVAFIKWADSNQAGRGTASCRKGASPQSRTLIYANWSTLTHIAHGEARRNSNLAPHGPSRHIKLEDRLLYMPSARAWCHFHHCGDS